MKDIEETVGVSAAAPVAVAAAAPAEGGAAAEEKTDFDVVLEGFGLSLIHILTRLGRRSAASRATPLLGRTRLPMCAAPLTSTACGASHRCV